MTAYRSLKAIPKASSLFVPPTANAGPKKGGAKCEISPGCYCSELQKPAFFMKLRRESVENGDFSGPEGAFKNRFSGRNRIEIPSGLKIGF
jgi:hypothetical protein